MKTISKLKSVLVLMVFAAAIFSCSDSNETDYTGVNSIYVKTSEAPVMIASDSTPRLHLHVLMTSRWRWR